MYVYIISIIIGTDMNIYCGILNYAMIFIYAVSLLRAVLCQYALGTGCSVLRVKLTL
jgi:hypothetical protein